jgi:putative ABC transport system substrate-binding protein
LTPFSRRRLFLAMSALALPGIARAQAAPPHRVATFGFAATHPRTRLFRESLAGVGLIEPRNLLLKSWAPHPEPADTVREILAWQPQVVVAFGSPLARAVQKETAAVPIVFNAGADPVAAGLVQSLARPGLNVTGVHTPYRDQFGKRIQLAREVLPRAKKMGFVFDRTPRTWTEYMEGLLRDCRKMAGDFGFAIVEADVTEDPPGLMAALERLAKKRVEVVLVFSTIYDPRYYQALVELQKKRRIPVVEDELASAEKGALLAVENDPVDYLRDTAEIVARILKGARPTDIPVRVSTRFRTAVNLKAAREMGVAIPEGVRLRADTVIQ